MQTIPHPSRLPIEGSTFLPSLHTFGGLSNFLRGALADEDSRLFSESMGALAAHSELVVAALCRSRQRDTAAPVLMDMLTVLRDHRAFVVGLGPAWRGLYEYASYLQGLNNFRVLIGQWLLHARPWDEQLEVTAADFERVAWRTMGDGMLLVDMYEQWLHDEAQPDPRSGLGELQPRQVERVLQWWHRLRR